MWGAGTRGSGMNTWVTHLGEVPERGCSQGVGGLVRVHAHAQLTVACLDGAGTCSQGEGREGLCGIKAIICKKKP